MMLRRLMAILLTTGFLAGVLASPASAGPIRVLQPHQKYAGKTYGQWSADWWQWAANIPEPNSPVDDPTGRNCAVDQSGPVWFLAGTTSSAPVTRRCTIPAGKAVLFPIINGECSTLEGNGDTTRELARCARDLVKEVSAVRASIDGKPVQLGPRARRFAFQSPPFTITFAAKNGFYPDGSLAGSSKAVAYGYWVLVRPPRAGRHEIAFHAQIPGFTVDVRYDLTIGCPA